MGRVWNDTWPAVLLLPYVKVFLKGLFTLSSGILFFFFLDRLIFMNSEETVWWVRYLTAVRKKGRIRD